MTRPGYAGCRKPRRQKKSKVARRARAAKSENLRPRPPVFHGAFMAMRRSSQMLILGLAIFVIGAGVVLVSFMGSGGGKDESSASTTTTTIQAGTVVVNAAPSPQQAGPPGRPGSGRHRTGAGRRRRERHLPPGPRCGPGGAGHLLRQV